MEGLATAFRTGTGWGDAIKSEARVKAAAKMEQSKKYLEEYKKLFEDYNKLLKDNKLTDPDPKITKPPTTPTATKSVNRIEDLKKQMDDKLAMKQIQDSKEYKSEEELRKDELIIYQKYATLKLEAITNLNDKEKESKIKLESDILKNTQSIVSKQSAEYEKLQKHNVEAKKKEIKESIQSNEERVKGEKKTCDEIDRIGEDAWQKQKKREEEEANKQKELQSARLKAEKEISQAIFDIAQTISDAILARELQRLDTKDKALQESHKNELRFIEQSGMTSLQQTKAKAKLEAEFEAQQKKIDRDRITAQRKAAKINRDISIANIIAKTAEAIMADLTIPVGGEILAVATAAIGAAELARVIATPLPQYAKGRGKGKDEFAIVGEAGREAILRGDGRLEITPNAPTKTFLKADDMVLNNSELMSAIYRTAMVKLADGSKVSTDSIQMALLEKTDEEIIELKGLRQDLRAKNLTANYYGLSGFESYRQSNIR
jgi:hypothetical protein